MGTRSIGKIKHGNTKKIKTRAAQLGLSRNKHSSGQDEWPLQETSQERFYCGEKKKKKHGSDESSKNKWSTDHMGEKKKEKETVVLWRCYVCCAVQHFSNSKASRLARIWRKKKTTLIYSCFDWFAKNTINTLRWWRIGKRKLNRRPHLLNNACRRHEKSWQVTVIFKLHTDCDTPIRDQSRAAILHW